MKLEKMNEQQIRCTLTSEDLKERRIKLSELAYGTDKAQSLFRDMMIQASNELDFEVNDEPLMIEAVPMSSDSMVLTITKVDDPDELDTRFARFAPDVLDDKLYDDDDELLPMIPHEDIQSWLEKFSDTQNDKIDAPAPDAKELVRLFSLPSIDECINVSRIIAPDYIGDNTLYKDNRTGRYLLLVSQSDMDILNFNRICNIISEYGESEKNLLATSAYLEEHCEAIIKDDAIARLSLL